MKIKKIYLKKRTNLFKYNKYLITVNLDILNNKNKVAHRINEPLFRGGSFIKVVITEKNNNLIEILTHSKVPAVCLFYNNKWYLGNHIKQKNLLQQNKAILSLLSKLKNNIA